MKFKMNERSLFAILLRSPWWVSVLIVLVFALAARALLPAQYVAVGVLGTLPFMVIAVMAAIRQWRAPSAARVSQTLGRVAGLSWRDFSDELARTLQAQGYQVERGEGEGVDFTLTREGKVWLLSGRRWKAATHGVEALRQLQSACAARGAVQGWYLSLAPVSEAAAHFAKEAGVRLVGGAELARWLLAAR